MGSEHLVKSYEEELKRLDGVISQMGTMAESQLEAAITALARRDSEAARSVQERDARIDQLEHDVDAFTIRLLALRQPVADDLRTVVAALRISIDLERIADYAANVAKRVKDLNHTAPEEAIRAIQELGQCLIEMMRDALTAYRDRDAEKASEVWRRDDEVDQKYLRLLEFLRGHMVHHPESVAACTHLLFVTKNLERLGDHLTNVCEHIQFLVRGVPAGNRGGRLGGAEQPR